MIIDIVYASLSNFVRYKFIIYHAALFAIMLFFFMERKVGFKKSRGIVLYIAAIVQKANSTGKVNATMSMYREHSKKFRITTVLLPMAMTLLVVYILTAHLIFFSIVLSDSMYPVFKKGDMVLMQNVIGQPKVGDIITFPDPEGLILSNGPVTVTHRIYAMSGDKITTKGDNNPLPDDWIVLKKNIRGKVIILNNKPIVLKDEGKYFLIDYRIAGGVNPKFFAILSAIQSLKAMGMMLFFICIAVYLFMSVRDSRPSRRFKSR